MAGPHPLGQPVGAAFSLSLSKGENAEIESILRQAQDEDGAEAKG